jgi:Ca2+-binding EF-hand superfamily protein
MSNTGFTNEQINIWHEDFLIKCPNGGISKKQFCTYYKSLLPSNLNDKSKANLTKKLFHLFDIDGDDYLNYPEFLVSFWIRCQAPIKEKFLWLFNAYDLDKNGVLDYGELKTALTCCLDINLLDELLEQLNDENLSYFNKNIFIKTTNKITSTNTSSSTDDDDEAFYDDNSAFSSKSNFSSFIIDSPQQQIQFQQHLQIQQQQKQQQQQQYNIYSRTTKLLDDKLNELIIQIDRTIKLMVINNDNFSSTSSLQSTNEQQQQQQYFMLNSNVNFHNFYITRKNFVSLCVKYKFLRKLLIPIDYYYEEFDV